MKHKRNGAWMVEVGVRLAITRRALGLQQKEMAKLFDAGSAAWNHYETGKRLLDVELAMKVSRRFRLSLDWLYMGDPSALPHALARKIQSEGHTSPPP